MVAPDRQAREWDALVLRTVGMSQEETAGALGMSKTKVRQIEGWFKDHGNGAAALLCQEELIKRTAGLLIETNQIIKERFLPRLRAVTAGDVLRKYGKAGTGDLNDPAAEDPAVHELAKAFISELRYTPPPDLILPLLEPGLHRIGVVETSVWIITGRRSRAVGLSTLAEGGEPPNQVFFIHSSLDGMLSVACPVESQPEFGQLLLVLDGHIKKAIVRRRTISREYLSRCRSIQKGVEDDVRSSTGAKFVDPLLQGLQRVATIFPWFPPGVSPPSQLLSADYWQRIYQLAVLSRLSGEDLSPDERNYDVRKSLSDVLSSELYLGDTHLATGPVHEPSRWLKQHRESISIWAGSPDVSELVEVYNALRETNSEIQKSLNLWVRS